MRQADNRITRGIFVDDQEPSSDHRVDERLLLRACSHLREQRRSRRDRLFVTHSHQGPKDSRQGILDVLRECAHQFVCASCNRTCEAAEGTIGRKSEETALSSSLKQPVEHKFEQR